jgi:hypothetical protein
MNTKEVLEKIVERLGESNFEGTASPYWLIIDPRQNMRCSIDEAASQITGPFFSRESATHFLDNTRYRFSNKAKVYCHSAHDSYLYDQLCRAISDEKEKNEVQSPKSKAINAIMNLKMDAEKMTINPIAFREEFKKLGGKTVMATAMGSTWTATPDLDKIIRDHNIRSWIKLILFSIFVGVIMGLMTIY